MNKAKYFGLLGIPLATLGIVGSVAFAETNAQQIVAPTLAVQHRDFEVADQIEVPDQLETNGSETLVNPGDDAIEAGDGSDDAETNDGPDGGPTDDGN